MHTYAKILGKTSYQDFNSKGYSPLEKLYKHLMNQKAMHIYPDKLALAELQLKLIKIAKTINAHSKDPEQTSAAINELQQLQEKSRKIISDLHQKDDEFLKYSKTAITNIKEQTITDVHNVIQAIENTLGKKIPEDIKSLLFDNNGEPINSEKLDQIVKDRIKKGSNDE